MGMRSSSSGGTANWINVAYCAAGGVLHINDEHTRALLDAAKAEADQYKRTETLSYDGAKVTNTIRESLANSGVLDRDARGKPLDVEIEGNLDFVALDERKAAGQTIEYFKMVLSDQQENGTVDKYSISIDFTSSLAQHLIVKLLSAKPGQRVLFKPWPITDEKDGNVYVNHTVILNDVATGQKIEKPATFKEEITSIERMSKERCAQAGIDDPKVIRSSVKSAQQKYYRDIVMTLIGRFQRNNEQGGGNQSQDRSQSQQSQPARQPAAQAPAQHSGNGGYQQGSFQKTGAGIPNRQPAANQRPATVAADLMDDDIPF